MTRLLCSLILSILAIVAPTPIVASSAVADDKTEFESALAQVQRLMNQRKWEKARTLLKEQLASHVDQEYVRARLPEIKQSLERCAFETAFPRKQVKDLFSARSVSWDEKKGEIDLVYDKEKPAEKSAGPPSSGAGEKRGPKEAAAAAQFPPADFQRIEGIGFVPDRGKTAQRTVNVWIHALPFTERCSLELSGTGMGQGQPSLRVGIDGSGCIETLILPGDAPMIFQITNVGGKPEGTCLAVQTGMINAVRPYVIEVKADKNKVEGWYNDKRVVSAKRGEAPSGQLGFADVDGVRKIRLTGKVDAKWIEERLAALSESDRDAFQKSYDVKSDLPAWLQ